MSVHEEIYNSQVKIDVKYKVNVKRSCSSESGDSGITSLSGSTDTGVTCVTAVSLVADVNHTYTCYTCTPVMLMEKVWEQVRGV